MIRHFAIVVTVLMAASCSTQPSQRSAAAPSPASAVKVARTTQGLLQTDLVVDAGVVGNAVFYQEVLPPATVAGTIAQSFEASWNASIHNLYAPPVYPQGWSLTYYAGATALGSAPSNLAQWQSVSRIVATGAVVSDGIDGERQALVSSITAPPVVIAASFSGGSAGDGWDTFFDPAHTRVFNVHHHDSPPTIMCRNLADSTTCPGYPIALDHTHFRATARFDDTSLKIWETTANNGYLAWDCVDSTTNARCSPTPVVRSTQLQRNNGSYVDHSDPVVMGRKLYAVGRNPSASVITCLDMSTATECTGVTLPNNGDGNHAGIAAVGTRLYVTAGENAGIDCYESTTMQRCPGTWPVASYHGPVWGVPNSDGSVSNVCSDSHCYALDGTATTLPPNFVAYLAANPVVALSYTGIQYGKATSMANLAAWTITSDRVACWNLQTDTKCSANFPISVGAVYAPTFDPQDTDCLWTNGDDGVIRNWRISTGTQGCSGGPPKISFKAAISIPRLGCDPATRVWQYKSFKLVTPTPSQYTSATLTVRNSFGAPVAGWTGVAIPAATATVDLSTLNTALTGSTPTFEVAAPGFTDTSTIPGADFRVTTGATPQLCFSLAGPTASCPSTAGIATATAGTTQNTTDSFNGSYSVSGGGTIGYTQQSLAAIVPDTTPYVGNCGGSLTVSAKTADSSAAPGVVVALLDGSGNPVLSGGTPVTATTDAAGNASFSLWANVAYKLKMSTMQKYAPVSMTVISGGLGVTNASGGVVTSNAATPPLSSTAAVFLSVNSLVPAPPTIASPTGGVVSNKPLVQGSCVTGTTVTVYEGTTSLCTATCASSTYSCRTSQLTDGSHTITATQANGAGESNPSAGATFTVQTVVLTVTPGTTTFNALQPAVIIDPALTVTGTGTISGATVTIGANLSAGDVLAFTNQNGISGSYDSNKGILTLSGTATPAQYQAALASVTFNNTAGATPANATRAITFALGTGVSYSANSHFYEYISGSSWTWLQAQSAAASRSYFGLQGYLVTVTSAAENAYVSSKLQGAGWMGATAPVGAGYPRVWTWATGPEAGQSLCNNTSSGVCTPISGAYTDWNSGEPNNSGNAEPRAQFLANGLWNDLPDNYGLPGYVVEYGGLPGEPSLSITGSRNVAVVQASVITVSPTPSNGTVSCTSPVVAGTDATCTITPAISYRLSLLTDNGVDVTASVSGSTYTIVASTGAHTIAAVFVYVPPVLTVSAGTTGYDALSSPVIIDPSLTLVGPGTITGATVTVGAGFATGDVLAFVDQNGITGSYDAVKGILTLSGTAAVSDYQTALASVTYANTAGAYPATALRTITFAVGGAVSYQANSHFYEYISGGSLTWLQAQAAASARSYYGLKGYLATIGDAAENAYVSSKLRGAGWMGAASTSTSGLPSFPRTWTWVTGPETGTDFCLNTASGVCSPINGGFTQWNGGEPNNAGNEYRAQFLANGLWNDLSNTAVLSGYVVEYGGMAGDPSLSILGSKALQVRAATQVSLASSLNASEWMQDVHFTASFTPLASTGTAQFQIDGSDFGAPVVITNGVATSGTITILTIGTHTVTVSYAGDVERQPVAGSLSGGQLVLKASNGGGLCTTSNANDVCVSGVCDPDGKCGYANNTGPCTTGDAATICRTGVCDPDGKCGYADGDGTCTAGSATPICRSGFCGDVSGICRANGVGGCGDDRDCSSAQYCDGNTFTCLNKVASGVQLPNDPRHNAGVCSVSVGAAVCVGGACETGDNACGVTNTHACSTNANCRSGICGADHLCGVPNAGSCSASTECRAGVCANGTCGAPNGASCAEGAACLSGICGADLRCGVPNGGGCSSGADCRAGVCAADGRCGEPNGGTCSSGDVCRGGSCTNGHCGSTCSTSSECAAGTFCTTGGACAPQLPNGGSCTAASQCASGLCAADGKCGGATGDACSTADQCRGGSCTAGQCGSSCTGSNDCAQGLFCSAGSCVPRAPNGSVCSAADQCVSNVCGADGKCGATNGYPCAGATDCRSGICDAQGTCDDQCASDRDCVAGNYCDATSHACLAVHANGGACAANDQCTSLVCDTDGICGGANGRPCGLADNCRSGVCATDGQCGTANAAACASAVTCRSNVCEADGQCGGLPGASCESSAGCRAGLCGADGKCGEPNGSPCAHASDCRSGQCAADGVCGDDVAATCTSAETCRTGACVSGQCSRGCAADADCVSGAFCDSGTCKAKKANAVSCSRAAECRSQVCGADGACGGIDGTSCANPAQCRSGECASGTCGGSCSTDTECLAGSFCSNGSCTQRKANGQACTSANQCLTNLCVGGSCGVPNNQPCSSATQCRSAICDDATGGCAANCSSNSECELGFYCDSTSHACLPAATNGHSPLTVCTTNSQCSSGVCGPDGSCGLPDGSQCVSGSVCRGNACVAGACASTCAFDAQCASGDYCTANGTCATKLPNGQVCTKAAACLAGTCASDGKCGTPDTQACSAALECRGGACANGVCSSRCASDSECASGSFCSANSCVAKYPAGTQCQAASQCQAGVCAADGRCGRPQGDACAAASQCRSQVCSSGQCASACALDTDCPTGDFCDPASKVCLVQGPNGTGGPRGCAGPADCASGVCASDFTCGYPTGGGSCNTVNGHEVCRSATCSQSTGTCVPGGGTGCAADTDCATGTYCDAPTLNCVAKLPAGTLLPTDGLHNHGVCTPAIASAVCVGGVCDPADNRCGVPNARPCTAANQCRSGVCGADGLCGEGNGASCTAAGVCRSGACVDGQCGQPNGGACTAASQCVSGLCVNGTCGKPNGLPCTAAADCASGQCASDGFCGQPTGGGCVVGDGCRSGACVKNLCADSCTADAQCATGLACLGGSCKPQLPNGGSCSGNSQCASGTCASGTCGKPTGDSCSAAGQCQSNTCSAGHCAATCAADGDCLASSACIAGTCTPKAPGGTVCSRGAECAAGVCVAGTCGKPTGQACSAPGDCHSNICDSNGTCADTCARDTECPAATYCGPQHSCIANAPNGQPCSSASHCASGICVDGSCGFPNGQGACTPLDASTACQSGACGGASHTCVPAGGLGCSLDADCDALSYCVPATRTCAAKLANGQAVPNDSLHNAGVCTVEVGKRVCASGVCDTQDSLCGEPNDALCTNHAQCRGGACGPDGRCGTLNGSTCSTNGSCRSGICDADGKCGSTTGSCTSGADCRNDICFGGDQHCGLPSGTACVTNAECRGGVCAADGRCGAPTGDACSTGDACRSGACVGGHCGSPCTADSQCGAATFCQSGQCVAKAGNGSVCTKGSQCTTGVCGSDGRCGGATGDTCSSAAGCRVACTNGSCSSSCTASTDCAAGTFCKAGACVAGQPNGAACTLGSQCAAGVCGADGTCGAPTGAACVRPQNCRSGICDSAGVCADVCSSTSECPAGDWCEPGTHSCTKTAGVGAACSSAAACATGSCGSNGLCGGQQGDTCSVGSQCQSGVCDPTDLRCGLANGSSGCTDATAANVCRSGVCVNGTCGLQDGAVCSADTQCASGFCSPARTCAPKGEAPPLSLKGGTGCSTTGDASLWAVLALLGLVVRRARRMSRGLARAAVIAAVGLASSSFAQTQALVQGFAAQNFDPGYAGDQFFSAPTAATEGHLLPSVRLTFDYGNQPVRILSNGALIPNGLIVRDQFWGHLDVSLALFNRVRVDLSSPLALYQSGDSQSTGSPGVQGGRLGDLRLGVRGSLLGAPTDAFALGVQADLFFPSGSREDFTGAGTTRGQLRVIASGFATERIIYSAALGLQLTPHRELGLGDVGSSLTWQAGAAILLADKKLQVGPELYGSTVLASGTSPLEAMLGARYRVDQFVFGAGVGAGLTGAASAAVWRGLVSLAWEPKPEPPKPAPVQVECPQPKDESATRDSDSDGIADKVDACQFVAGVASSESAKNGCPADADGDAVADAQDACPAVPGLVDHNGCPPPADRDHDGIDDAEDVCPDVAGPVDSPKKGCPPETAALKEAHIELAERVEFGNDKAQLLGTSENVLRSVAQVMNAHPELAKVSIEGFTDNRGNAAYNVQLSADRAAAVLNWLAKNGVDKSRMVSKGFGADKPIASNDDEAGRQRNRRVEIRVLEYKAAQ